MKLNEDFNISKKPKFNKEINAPRLIDKLRPHDKTNQKSKDKFSNLEIAPTKSSYIQASTVLFESYKDKDTVSLEVIEKNGSFYTAIYLSTIFDKIKKSLKREKIFDKINNLK